MLGRKEETLNFFSHAPHRELELVGVVALWSGLAVNCVAYQQVLSQQSLGPARAQILYASQPLWAMFLAAIADLNCPAEECEV